MQSFSCGSPSSRLLHHGQAQAEYNELKEMRLQKVGSLVGGMSTTFLYSRTMYLFLFILG